MQDADSVMKGFLTDGGTAILVGGVFGSVLRSFQFMGVFKEALSDIIFEEGFLEIRRDLVPLWRKLSTAIYKKKFPELSSQIHDAVITGYLPVTKDFYYKNYDRVCSVSWKDHDASIVEVAEEVQLDIVPAQPEREISYFFRRNQPKGDVHMQAEHIIKELNIDGKNYTEVCNQESKKGQQSTEELHTTYEVKLKGKDKYRVVRKTTSSYPLSVDPCIKVSTDQFLLGAKIRVYCPPPDLKVSFVSSGTLHEFNDCLPSGRPNDRARDLDFEYKDLIFPRQGFILLLSRI